MLETFAVQYGQAGRGFEFVGEFYSAVTEGAHNKIISLELLQALFWSEI